MTRLLNPVKASPLLTALLTVLLTSGCAHYQSKPLNPIQSASTFEARTLDDPGLNDFVRRAGQTTNWPPVSWNFETLTFVALYYHPNLEVARAQMRVSSAAITTAGGRPNPILSVIPGYSANSPAGVSPWFPLATLDVPIETAHKRMHRISHANELAEASRLNVYSTAWQVRGSLRAALVEHSFVQQRIELLEKQVQSQRELVTLLEQRLAAGMIAAPEVAPARVGLLKALAELANASSQVATSRSAVAQALGLPLKALAGIAIETSGAFAADGFQKFTSAEARNAALQSRPDILAALSEYAASEAALQLEIAKQYPDVHLSPGYQFDQGEHKWSLGLSMELPVLNRNQGPIAEALEKRSESSARFLALQAKVTGEIDRALQTYSAAQDQLRNSQAVLESEQKQSAALEEALKAGGADQFEVMSIRLETSIARLAMLDGHYKVQQSLGQLEDAFQIPFDALRNVEKNPRAQAMSEHP